MMPAGGVMAGDCGVTGAGVCGKAGATVAAPGGIVAATGAAFTGMNSGPFCPQPLSAGIAAASTTMADSSAMRLQITPGRYDANVGFTIRITV